MIKSNHTFFLKILDNILDSLNNANKTYTLTYQELFKLVAPSIVYDKIYQDALDNWLGGRFDKYIEESSKPYLLNSALLFLINDDYIHKFEPVPKQYSFQITYKGFLKIHLGFVKEYQNEIAKIKKTERQQRIDDIKSTIRAAGPFIGFLFGLLSAWIIKNMF